MADGIESQELSFEGSGRGNALAQMLNGGDISPGDAPSYELCKTIYLYHPLGAKLAEAPVALAQAKPREIAVKDSPDEVRLEFLRCWEEMNAEAVIFNEHRTSRIYGLASIVAVSDGFRADKPFDMAQIYKRDVAFNVLDPLNTAGSLVLDQIPTEEDFQKPLRVVSGGQSFHRTRFHVAMNELPIYLAYTGSAFGFVGRSVYQRVLFPLKSFLQTMIADDVIAHKNALIVSYQESPGSVVSRAMERLMRFKRLLVKRGRNGNVLTVGINEKIETLDMQNVDGAGRFARENILKNIATGADMPASLVNNETLVSGFGEGAEDAKNIARYGETYRLRMQSSYRFMDNFCMYKAWNPEFYSRIQKHYPNTYSEVPYQEAFATWRRNFQPAWPSLLLEPESEKVNLERTKLEGIISYLQTLSTIFDPHNHMLIIQWAADNISENKLLFPHPLELDWDRLGEYLEQNEARQREMGIGPDNPDKEPADGGLARKLAKFG